MLPLLNAFSLNMIKVQETQIVITEIPLDDVKYLMRSNECKSYIGHKDLAEIVSEQTQFSIPVNRENFVFGEVNRALVFQYNGPRLEEGTRTLPQDAKIKYYHVKVK
jgi:hypothetical protein